MSLFSELYPARPVFFDETESLEPENRQLSFHFSPAYQIEVSGRVEKSPLDVSLRDYNLRKSVTSENLCETQPVNLLIKRNVA